MRGRSVYPALPRSVDVTRHSEAKIRTGTFFCDKTTAQSLPRRPTDMMFAAVIALKAYSVLGMSVGSAQAECLGANEADRSMHSDRPSANRRFQLTDLVQTTIVGKDGNVSVVCAG